MPTQTPIKIDEEYDIIIAGGAPSFSLSLFPLTEREFNRRYCGVRSREPHRDIGPRPSHPRAGSGSPDERCSSAQVPRALAVARHAGLANHPRTRWTSECRAWGSPPGRAGWPVSWRWKQCKLYVSLPSFLIFVSGRESRKKRWLTLGSFFVRFETSHDVHPPVRLRLR
jgi:hypothetical protein